MDFGSYLRTVREQPHISLDEVARRIKIRRDLLIDLERNNVSRWPKHRVYRHGYLRAYAEALGLDPSAVIAKFDEEFGDLHPAPFQGPPKRPARAARFSIKNDAVLTAVVGILLGAVISLAAPFLARLGSGTPSMTQVSATSLPPRLLQEPAIIVPVLDASGPADDPVEDPVEDGDIEGEIRISSSPPQAHVTVNGIGRGPTPVRVRYLPPGEYVIRVIHPGYRAREARVVIDREQPIRAVRISLRETRTLATASLDALQRQQP